MIRICFLADASSIHTQRWCRHFAAQGYHVEVISFKSAAIENIPVHYVDAGNIDAGGGNWKVLLKVGKVKKLLRQIKPDILHAHYATSYGIVGALTRFKPFIVTTLGSDILISAQQSAVYRRLVKYVLKRATHITAMAPHMQEAIVKLGIPPEKISIVMFGIDPAIFNSSAHHVSPGEFVITSTRNFEPVYNHQLFFDALKQVKDKIHNLKVYMVGDGSMRAYFENLVHEYGLGHVVTFTGKISQPDIAALLNKTHLFITVALSDGNCISLNEAMACGTYTIAGDIAATRQWIVEGENGFLVPLDKPGILAGKIMEVYHRYPELAAKAHAINGNIIAGRALWSVNMQRMETIYKNALTK